MQYNMVHCEQGMPVYDDDMWLRTDIAGFLGLSMKYRNAFNMQWDGSLRALDNTPLSVLWSDDVGFRVIQTRV